MMNTNIEKSLNEFIRLMKNPGILPEEKKRGLKIVKKQSGGIPTDINRGTADLSPVARNTGLNGVSGFIPGNGADAAALAVPASIYEHQSVISILKNFSRVSYTIDFTSGNIDQRTCRQLIKFMLAIAISVEQDEISEEVVEKNLILLDEPLTFNFALNYLLMVFMDFVRHISAINKPLYLVDADTRWAPGIASRENMGYASIPCEFSTEQAVQAGKAVQNVYLSFNMFGNRFELSATISGNTQVENMSLNVTRV